MRLVIDLQGAQGSNRNRGIGRYCLSVTQGLARLRGKHEVIVVLSSLFPDTIETLRRSLEDVLPPEAIRIMHLAGPVHGADPGCDARREAAELMREQFLASLNPDFVLVTSLFEGLGDDVVSSIGRFTTRIPTAAILYDLIPLINRGIYLQNPVLAKWYERKLAHLRNADLLLAISQSTREEAIEWLGAGQEEAVNISTAAEDHFTPAPVSAKRRAELGKAYGLMRPFVMYTGGIDHRKNIEGLIKAYAMLPSDIRRAHQLAIVCSIQPADRDRLTALAAKHGLGGNELVLTGYIPEEDLLACYRACKMFVFPSWHEGFGLPALEAMRCGRAVIAGDRSSLPEVIGTSEALFDPYDIVAISQAISAVLTDDKLRERLERHGLEQAKRFSWDQTAQAAWDALLTAHEPRTVSPQLLDVSTRKPRLAFVSPLPPEASGISDYSAELLPELARHYRIEVIVRQDSVSDPAITANYPVRSIDWFRRNAHGFDRILYHFGNSHFHSHMFDLIRDYPGVVVLHDFFLSGIVANRDVYDEEPGGWARALFETHGWPAVVHRFKAADTADVIWAYPANISVLQHALGMIVHANFSRQLAQTYYGSAVGNDWDLIPLLRQPASGLDRTAARTTLGIGPDDFVVCSFGILGPMKMNDRLLSAWFASPLADNPDCHLIFVGQNSSEAFGQDLERQIRTGRSAGRIEITGWMDQAGFRHWLAAADIGVQLRTLSRGETSAAVLDCMNVGLPTIVNANGSMAELDADAVWMMPDDFSDDDLIEALSTLHADAIRRRDMGDRARARIASHNNPRRCAADYASAIEAAYERSKIGQTGLEGALAESGIAIDENDWLNLVQAMGRNAPPALRRKKLLVDISELVQRDWGSGIQRVVRSILSHWLLNPPADYIVEPVYAEPNKAGYRYARQFTSRMLDIWPFWCEDETVEPVAGDIFVGLDLQPAIVPQQQPVLQEWRRMGVKIHFVIYDLLPAIAPEFFFPGARTSHHAWLATISEFDGVVCISRAVADEYREWLDHYGPDRITPLEIDWFHLGGDPEKRSDTSDALPAEADGLLARLRGTPSFLSVATVEPRKGFRQTLDAMEMLWAKGVNANFVIVGKPGWMMEDFIARLQTHPEQGRRLFWLQGISDNYLFAVYGACRYLIAASQGEGFGLPLIEAARYDLPVLARDIPVFREVARDAATYFPNSTDPAVLAQAIGNLLNPTKGAAKPPRMQWLTWAQSADALLACVLRINEPYLRWVPDGVLRFWGSDHRLQSQVGVANGTHIRTNAKAGFLVFGPFMPLEAGSWTIRAEGNNAYLDGSEVIDIASNGGTKVHFSAPLKSMGDQWMVEGDYVVAERVEGVEIRLLVTGNSDLSLAGISLTRRATDTADERQLLTGTSNI
jgi:glycosyltransferase involved in cell wall biosynthesis